MPSTPIGLYIHIPFCQTKCTYCNFNTYARLEGLIPEYVQALVKEVRLWGSDLDRTQVRSVFFGGGTPSWINADALAHIIDAANSAFQVLPDAEVTVEANPGDVNSDTLSRWREMGVNRISIGVQSFDDDLLKLLTRRHTSAEATRAVRLVKQAGFQSVSIDLMYGLPTQSMDTWRSTLDQALDLQSPHISMYALTVEEGTPMWNDVERGAIPQTDPDMAADMYVLAEERFGEAGYGHYEISNWALPGHECRHNLIYWRNEPFLGVGPGAHSYLGKERFWNIRSPADYVTRMSGPKSTDGATPVVEERKPLSEAEELSETLILQLRLDEGADPESLVHRFGEEAVRPHRETLSHFTGLGLLTESSGTYRLSSRGRLLSNELFVRLLAG